MSVIVQDATGKILLADTLAANYDISEKLAEKFSF